MQCMEEGDVTPFPAEFVTLLLAFDKSLTLQELRDITGYPDELIQKVMSYQLASLPGRVTDIMQEQPQLQGENNETYKRRLVAFFDTPKLVASAQVVLNILLDNALANPALHHTPAP